MEFVRSGYLGVLVFIGKSLFLDARHVDHISVADRAQQVLSFRHVGSMGGQIRHDLFGHLQKFGTGKDEFASKSCQGVAEGVSGSAVAQVACEDDLQAVKASVRLSYCEQVEHGLRWVMASTVSAVENGNSGGVLCVLRGALAWVAHGDDVGVSVNHLDGVKQGFALDHGGGFDVSKVDHVAAEALHRCFKGHARSGAGFKKQIPQNFTLQQREIHVAFCHRKKALSVVQDA